MRRRPVIGAAAGSILAATGVAPWVGTRAQVPGRLYRIGYLGFTPSNTPDDLRVWGSFVLRLRELGCSEGGNLVIEQRFAEGHNERYAEFAAEIVKLGTELVVASNGAAPRAVMATSRTMRVARAARWPPAPARPGLPRHRPSMRRRHASSAWHGSRST